MPENNTMKVKIIVSFKFVDDPKTYTNEWGEYDMTEEQKQEIENQIGNILKPYWNTGCPD